jgi:hypothetical protein
MPWHGHESLWALLAGGYRIGVHGDVPLPRVHIHRLWWRTLSIVGADVIGSRGGVTGVVATVVSTFVVVPAAITIVVVVVVAIIAVVKAATVVLARQARQR